MPDRPDPYTLAGWLCLALAAGVALVAAAGVLGLAVRAFRLAAGV